jgi:hypothetical protein
MREALSSLTDCTLSLLANEPVRTITLSYISSQTMTWSASVAHICSFVRACSVHAVRHGAPAKKRNLPRPCAEAQNYCSVHVAPRRWRRHSVAQPYQNGAAKIVDSHLCFPCANTSRIMTVTMYLYLLFNFWNITTTAVHKSLARAHIVLYMQTVGTTSNFLL